MKISITHNACVTIGIRNDMEVKRFDKIKDHVEIDMERKDGSEVLLTFTALEIAFMYYELRDLQSQVSKNESLHIVSQQRELLSQYNSFVNMQYHSVKLDDTDITDFIDWINCG